VKEKSQKQRFLKQKCQKKRNNAHFFSFKQIKVLFLQEQNLKRSIPNPLIPSASEETRDGCRHGWKHAASGNENGANL